jgi:hypothetical protein
MSLQSRVWGLEQVYSGLTTYDFGLDYGRTLESLAV